MIAGALSILLLSAGTDAFSVCPVTKSAVRCRHTTGVSSGLSASSSVHTSRWAWKFTGTRSSSVLKMADEADAVAEVTTESIAGREFQV